ncbi:unnamed protein product [Pieris macdunnoughi]|uniref:Uncharacterized protein n=1 Tax=Pieris macdunnoughi TaxID=345717 RepID=A0A821KTV2_9NEOP|nr:unnamed protein product [Pieris macdunnoughi]
MAAVAPIPGQLNQENSDDEPSPDEERQVTPFSIHDVLKKERETSPENVFATDKLLQSTPNFEDASNPESLRLDDTEISVDDNSCSSNDTVLSVGNENPVNDELSFKHIQTHLNAISQLSHFNTPLLLRPNPIPMFLNQSFYPQVKYQQNEERREDTYRREQKEERDFNPNLKFSIDNILKADFGRRITDPLKIRKKRFEGKKEFKEISQVRQDVRQEVRQEVRADVKEKGAIDLSKADGSPASSGGTSNSEGPMVWPAWVYCTRYSDRPSSVLEYIQWKQSNQIFPLIISKFLQQESV